MKVRLDFVSNSSSSSFIIACDGKLSSKVLKSIAKACANPHDEYHDKDLAKRNFRILDFCTNTYQLLFLGELRIKINKVQYELGKENSYSRDKCIMNPAEFEQYVNNIKEIENGTADHWVVDAYGRDIKIDDSHYMHYDNVMASRVVVTNGMMESHFYHYRFDTPSDEATVKRRVENIIETTESFVKMRDDGIMYSTVDVYCITLDTIENTRNLIDAGYTLKFDRWEDIDKLEQRLKSGDHVYYIREANSGDGYGDFYIYCEDGANGISGTTDIEILGSECG